ncbi:hypothetical protein [Brevibacterium sp. SMBL_HHYL_HB1]|uniref:HNH endonuclease n=1 Tax=Brevibacterium sp. SMBL_HHYL_HB1 TaxID=2777556 RepID=UPI001BAB4E43|nr:hypothetical protein [Brevibacterium sp. SMBL_HHYL_HB1]QUL79897.1 hypothetical protein IG171_03350 [Brevibacterium sp. SMBL_HHYL_HB1]
MSKKVRQQVYERDGYMCVSCGRTDTLTLNHRASKGMGGSKLMDGPENLVTMCLIENQRLEANADFAALGIDNGWKLRSWDDPLKVPVFFAFDGWYYLTTDGTRTKRP